MNVLVNGIGNIGTTVLNLLARYKKEVGIKNIYAHKNTLKAWGNEELEFLRSLGIILCSTTKTKGFEDFNKILPTVDYVFETGANGSGIRNKKLYESLHQLKGGSAQGSEKGFGISFMSGINNDAIKNEKFVHVVSCNTHGTAALMHTISGSRLENLLEADVVVVRRSEDLGNHERLVSANVVARHLDTGIGTHHAIDVLDLFKTIGLECTLTSSDITTPSQLMHAVRFNITLKKPITRGQLFERLKANPFISTTEKFDSNIIFENGRRYGFNGRIFSHAIVVANNIMIHGKTVKGWAFVPQEGNSILSTLHAFLLQTGNKKQDTIMKKIMRDLLRPAW